MPFLCVLLYLLWAGEAEFIKDLLQFCVCLCLLLSGSVLDIIKHQREQGVVNGMFDEVVIATILNEALKGLEYFHTQGQIHR